MRIGILTYHRAHNYGAVLQCYALQEIIRKKGHVVEVIDYRQPHIEKQYAPKIDIKYMINSCIQLRLRDLFSHIRSFVYSYKRKKQFNCFKKQFLACSQPINDSTISQKYDRYIIGSDQVWGLHCTNGYDPIYWGNFIRQSGSRLYGFSISGNTGYRRFISEEQIKNNIDNFDGLSFRETDIRDDIYQLTGVKGLITLDPTLLSNSEIWDPLINKRWKKKNYIALYQVRYPNGDKSCLSRKAEELARKNNYDLIDLSTMEYSVEDFVSIIKYAKCVVTSSFHATVFSIIFDTPFYTFKLNDNRDGRYVDLLEQLHLQDHLAEVPMTLSTIPTVNKKAKGKYLPLLQIDSLKYLNTILS